MTHPALVIVAVLALAALYVLLPVMVGAFRQLRGHRTLRCPESGEAAEVALDSRHAALTSAFGPPHLRVSDCSLWPERSGCRQACLSGP
ncbi:MAG: hypothetical protein ACE5IM_02835 [Nitrospinota bacterium]